MEELHYRPEIDGLRAIAVLSVVFFHAGILGFSGGFIGVDIFFVISGYLITGILWREMTSGQYSIWDFYRRRACRILPALVVIIIICSSLAYSWFLQDQFRWFVKALTSVIYFVANFFYSNGHSYFDTANFDTDPLGHVWSLSIEEQFYIILPFVLIFARKHFPRSLVKIFVLVFIISISYAEYYSWESPAANYFSPLSRSWELLAGSIAAIGVRNSGIALRLQNSTRSSFVGQIVPAIGLLLVFFSVSFIDGTFRYPSIWTLFPVSGTVFLLMFATNSTFIGRFLAFRPFVLIGLVSYSFYLWHQPVFAFARWRFGADNLTTSSYVLLILLALIGSTASYVLVERPARRFRHSKPQTVVIASLVSLTAIFTAARSTDIYFEHNPQMLPKVQLLSDHSIRWSPGVGKTRFTCDFPEHWESKDCQNTESPQVAVWGDSFGKFFASSLLAERSHVGFVQFTKSGCMPSLDGSQTDLKSDHVNMYNKCVSFNESVKRYITEHADIKYVFLVSRLDRFTSTFRGHYITADGIHRIAEPKDAQSEMLSAIDWLHKRGIVSIIVASAPYPRLNVANCYRHEALFGKISERKCDFSLRSEEKYHAELYDIYRALEKYSAVLYLKDYLCGADKCPASADGDALYVDDAHLSLAGAKYLGQRLDLTKLPALKDYFKAKLLAAK